MLKANIYADAEALAASEATEYEADYVSLINNQTYGPPALIAPSRRANNQNEPRATPGERVLYINTNLVPAFSLVDTDEG